MFASIRRYRLQEGSMEELMRRVDEGFAAEIGRQPGFCSYEALDCGDGEVVTISVFGEAEQAEASRELAQRWSEENLVDLRFTRIETVRGEIRVSRAVEDVLEPAHAGSSSEFGSIRRYRLRGGSIDELMRIVDETFAEQVPRLPGFFAYHALDAGRGELLSISLFGEQMQAEASDELALAFVRERLGAFDIERSEVLGGRVMVSRARAEVLEPAHA
jgi:hypothetical protein